MTFYMGAPRRLKLSYVHDGTRVLAPRYLQNLKPIEIKP